MFAQKLKLLKIVQEVNYYVPQKYIFKKLAKVADHRKFVPQNFQLYHSYLAT